MRGEWGEGGANKVYQKQTAWPGGAGEHPPPSRHSRSTERTARINVPAPGSVAQWACQPTSQEVTKGIFLWMLSKIQNLLPVFLTTFPTSIPPAGNHGPSRCSCPEGLAPRTALTGRFPDLSSPFPHSESRLPLFRKGRTSTALPTSLSPTPASPPSGGGQGAGWAPAEPRPGRR